MDMSGDEVRRIVETLAYGDRDEISALIYGRETLTDSQLNAPLSILSELHDPTNESAISVAEPGYQEPFWMLILNVPWLNHPRAKTYTPLLLAHEDGIPKVAGKVMPWNEISHMFTKQQHDASTRLVTWWALFLKKLQ